VKGKSLNCWCSRRNPNGYQCFNKSREFGLFRTEKSPECNASSAAIKQPCDWRRHVKPRAKVVLFREGKMEQTEVAEHFSKEKH